jgi:hypothetical protein
MYSSGFKCFDPEVMAEANLGSGHIWIFVLIVEAPVLKG